MSDFPLSCIPGCASGEKRRFRATWRSCALAWIAVAWMGATPSTHSAEYDFNRDIRPILSNHCFQCHGPDEQKRESGLRLDVAESAMAPLESGAIAVVAGDLHQSAMIERILADDDSLLMPPPEINKPLSEAQKEILKNWISSGAKWSNHWAFSPVIRPDVPQTGGQWIRNDIDRFVFVGLERKGWQPAAEAERGILVRRLFLDLLGLPPSPAEVEAFVQDDRVDAYEQMVETLLASPHFGERMALQWLDASRFADTNGYHLDNGRDMSAWRAWVINAYNDNLPFDQFTIEQLAGDLLENASETQLIATGFHRNHMINFEGGAIPEEYHNAYIVDRVNTTGAVWMGMTVACGQCHDHKYDPLTQREYYQLYAFFNNIDEKGLDGNQGNAQPLLRLPTGDQQQRLTAIANEMVALNESLGQVVDGPESEAATNKIKEQLASLQKEKESLESAAPSTMVMRERAAMRETFVLERGQYDRTKDKVTPAVPSFLPSIAVEADSQRVLNRLDLAKWLVREDHPLTARVAVNRLWQSLFGIGLVKTVEDFGSQGEQPSNQALLDWLAAEFVTPSVKGLDEPATHSWDVKHMIRLMVTSATYRQTSRVSSENYARDPENRWMGRGARFRLPAELLRDQALAVSGLLKHNVGGPSVSPYQPEGLWQELSSRGDSKNWTAQEFVQSHGDDLYRRGMYTFWKRTSPPPMMTTFDAPDRETCTLQRSRTNTPLQALVLMNDPVFVESARKMAERVLQEESTSRDARLTRAMQLVAARSPRPAELDVLVRMMEDFSKEYADPEKAAALLKLGESPAVWQDSTELAAWTMVCSALLNLDEVVTRN